MSEEEQARYVKRLALAMRDWGADRRNDCEKTPQLSSGQEGGTPAQSKPVLLKGSRHNAHSEDHPTLKMRQDSFNRPEEPTPPAGRHPPLATGAAEQTEDSDAGLTYRVWKEPATGMEFISVRGGAYLMGAGDWDGDGHPNEKPVHEVWLDGFWIGKYPVTQGEWKKVMGSNPSQFKFGGRYPVECVSWLDTRQFIKRLNALNDGLCTFRLPTEAEWEYACRSGGRPEKYAGGGKGADLDALAWHAGNSGGAPHEVGAKKPNRLDLYDMSGNVWEWCEDIYDDTIYSRHESNNPVCRTGEPDHVIRGGSWYSEANSARCSSRGFLDQTFRRHYVGFRLIGIPMLPTSLHGDK
jgi:formylglycine-generating enzyme required for sulfatase activity